MGAIENIPVPALGLKAALTTSGTFTVAGASAANPKPVYII